MQRDFYHIQLPHTLHRFSTCLQQRELAGTSCVFFSIHSGPFVQDAGCEVQAAGRDPFDCNAALNNFFRAWSPEKKPLGDKHRRSLRRVVFVFGEVKDCSSNSVGLIS